VFLVEKHLRFALVNNERVEAQPKLKGLCPGCSQPVTAKCGTRRIKHWAHLPETPCTDHWWEPETEWHRSWKDKFPREWQEFVQHDQSGEMHRADVRTPHGLVIEFQYSHLDPLERAAREHFYGNMVWVVNGTRLKRDFARFGKGAYYRQLFNNIEVFLVPRPENCLPPDWLASSALVLFDFLSIAPIDPPDVKRKHLWCLFPGRAEGNAVLVALSREDFVAAASNSRQLLPAHEIVVAVGQQIRQQQARLMVS
jgi:hypothetical protein